MARAAPANSGTKKKSSKDGIQDPRLQHIKSVLYDNAGATQGAPLVQAPSQREATEVSRKSAVYTGPDSARMQRETIERAWCLLKKQEADEITAGLRRRFLAMRSAMQELEQLDPRLFEGTQGRKEVELFPKRLRVPTETPPMLGWDYERNHNVAQN
nr:39S ribosomal protein L28, mitochondrial [Polyrhizophydium stewartii]